MKKSEHKTTMLDVLRFISQPNPITSLRHSAANIGEYFWPDKASHGPSRGGPSSCAVSASYLLGKLRKRKLAEKDFKTGNWSITTEGRKFLEDSKAINHTKGEAK